MKRTQFAAVLSAAAISASLLSGCSAQLTTQETCEYISSRVSAPELNQTLADRNDVEKISKTASSILDDAAQRTGDEKLRDALVVLSKSTKETLRQYKAHMSGGTVSEKEDTMYDASRYETASYFLTACPGISPFS